MPTSCCVVGCTERAKPGSELGFYRFPSDKERRRLWIAAVSRKNWTPTSGSRVCGRHFTSGKSVAIRTHPDWAPSLYLRDSALEEDGSIKLQRYKRIQGRNCQKITLNVAQPEVEPSDSSFTESVKVTDDVPNDLVLLSELACLNNQSSKLMLLEKEVNVLKTENESLRKEIKSLSSENNAFVHAVHQLNSDTKVISNFELQENQLVYYTGVPNLQVFNAILKYVTGNWTPVCNVNLSYNEQLLLVLMKLRLGLTGQDLAYRFGIPVDKVSGVFQQWIVVLAEELKFLVSWPDSKCKTKKPLVFLRSGFKECTCIIDCTEIATEKPTAFNARSQTYSDYKGGNTVKFLVAINPHGVIIFVSKCWGGRVTDKELTLKCGFLDKLKPGDMVMSDRGFDIGEILASRGVNLKIPAFTKGKPQLARQEVEEARQISRVRVHVERAIGRMKNFRILQSTLPISLIKNGTVCTIDKIVTVCAALVNLKPSLVQ